MLLFLCWCLGIRAWDDCDSGCCLCWVSFLVLGFCFSLWLLGVYGGYALPGKACSGSMAGVATGCPGRLVPRCFELTYRNEDGLGELGAERMGRLEES